jgi:hypothetical protein
MQPRLNKSAYSITVSVLIVMAFMASCSKDAPFGIIQSEIAPPAISVGKDKYISSLQDTVSFLTVSSSAEVLTASNYKFKWTTVRKPDGAPTPVITRPSNHETDIYNMVPGEYQFQVEASNRKGSSRDNVNVIVVEDTLSGKTVIFNDLSWEILKIPTFPGATVTNNIKAILKTNFERPDLFFRKTWSMEIYYLNDGEQDWKSMKDFKVEINSYKSVTLTRENLTNDWLTLNLKGVKLRIRFL